MKALSLLASMAKKEVEISMGSAAKKLGTVNQEFSRGGKRREGLRITLKLF